jgi:hypothetical protein
LRFAVPRVFAIACGIDHCVFCWRLYDKLCRDPIADVCAFLVLFNPILVRRCNLPDWWIYFDSVLFYVFLTYSDFLNVVLRFVAGPVLNSLEPEARILWN